jgi:hypothetical protein
VRRRYRLQRNDVAPCYVSPVGMCERCDEIDSKIRHYRKLRNGINDAHTVDTLSAFIADLESEKATLHQTPSKKEDV